MTPFGKIVACILIATWLLFMFYGMLSFAHASGRKDGYIQSQKDLSQGKPAKWVLNIKDGKSIWVENKE